MSLLLYGAVISAALVLGVLITVTWRQSRRQQLANGQTAVVPSAIEQWWQALLALWRDVRHDERAAMQVVVAAAAIFISLSLGYVYGRTSLVDGWQLWTWLITVVVLVFTLLPMGNRPTLNVGNGRLLLGIGLLALLLRLPFLDTIPGGLHVDEMGVAGYAARHIYPPQGQTINPFHTGTSSQPALYFYMIRLFFAVLGYSTPVLRLSSVLAGTAAVLATYFVIRQLQDEMTALLAATIMTTYHYHIHWSRIGLNNIWDTLWVPLILGLFAWGWRRHWSGGAVLAGLALGLSQYFYAGNKISVFLLLILLIQLYWQNPDRRQLLIHGGKLATTAVAVAAPITLFAFMLPDVYFDRSRMVWGWQVPVVETAVGSLDYGAYLWQQLWRNVGAFTSVPEVTGFYGPGVPFLIGVAAPLFVIGFFWLLWQRRWIPVMWIVLTVIFGGILLSGAPSSSHYVVVIPAICWATAVPLTWLWRHDCQRLALLLLVVIMLTDLVFYFVIYVPSGPRDLFNTIPPWPWP